MTLGIVFGTVWTGFMFAIAFALIMAVLMNFINNMIIDMTSAICRLAMILNRWKKYFAGHPVWTALG